MTAVSQESAATIPAHPLVRFPRLQQGLTAGCPHSQVETPLDLSHSGDLPGYPLSLQEQLGQLSEAALAQGQLPVEQLLEAGRQQLGEGPRQLAQQALRPPTGPLGPLSPLYQQELMGLTRSQCQAAEGQLERVQEAGWELQ